MFRFRAKRKDNGEWVVGWFYHNWHNEPTIKEFDGGYIHTIHPSSLSISTGKLDSKEEEIFASFPLNGVMTTGGDVVRMLNGMQNFKVVYDLHGTRFAISTMNGDVLGGIVNTDISYTIIGKQGGGNE